MNQLMIFEGKQLEVIEWQGHILFNPYHVAEILGIKNVRENLRNFNGNQVIKLTKSIVSSTDNLVIPTAGKLFLTESGVYKLIFKSRKPEAEKFSDWVTDEVLPQIRKNGKYTVKSNTKKTNREEIMLLNAKTRIANTYLKLAKMETISEDYKKILIAKSAEVLANGELLPLPVAERMSYSAEDIGKELGISANMVGRIANANGLKIDSYGVLVHDKARHSNKEVPSFRYYKEVIPVLKSIIETNNGN